MILGADSAYPPTLSDAQEAFAFGIRWWGFYLNGRDGDEDPLNTWTPGQVNVLRQAGIVPVPIIVPKPGNLGNPVVAANESFGNAVLAGCHPKVSILYNGNHVAVTGPVWLPIPGLKPTIVGPRSAIQYQIRKFGGTTVDVSLASIDFPTTDSIVVDYENNTDKNVVWYQTYQTTIRELGGTSMPVAKCVDFVKRPQGGYYLVGADGGIFSYSGAPLFGNATTIKLAAPIMKMVLTDTGAGYWLIAEDYGIFNFGDAPALSHP